MNINHSISRLCLNLLTVIVLVLDLTGCWSMTDERNGILSTTDTIPGSNLQAITLSAIPTWGPPSEPSVLPYPWEDRSIFKSFLIPSQQSALDLIPGANLYHLDLSISSDFSLVTGKEETLYTNRTGQSLDEIYFRTFPNLMGSSLVVTNPTVNGNPAGAALEQQDSVFRISLNPALPSGKAVVIRLDFSLSVPQVQPEQYDLLAYGDHVLSLADFFPLIPAFDERGWHVEIPSPNGDFTYTESSFFVVRVTAVPSLIFATSGTEIDRRLADGKNTITWAGGPTRNFFIIASDRYKKISVQIGDTTINSFDYKDRQTALQLSLEHAKAALNSFSTRFGTYPYTQFNLVSTPSFELGVEYPGIVVIQGNLYDLIEPTPKLFETVIAHETAHQWFYNIVGNDPVNEPWLDEGLAQYVTCLYYRDTQNISAADTCEKSWYNRWDLINRANISIGLPVSKYTPPTTYNAIIYGRAPIFFDDLARKMGQDQFDYFLKDYCKTYQWQIVTTSTFESQAQKDCHCDLTGLYQLYGIGG